MSTSLLTSLLSGSKEGPSRHCRYGWFISTRGLRINKRSQIAVPTVHALRQGRDDDLPPMQGKSSERMMKSALTVTWQELIGLSQISRAIFAFY